MNIERALKLCFAAFVGLFLGLLASIPSLLWVYLMGWVSMNDCSYGDYCPPDLVIQWLILSWDLSFMGYPFGPIINFLIIGIIAGMVGGIIFHLRDQTPKKAGMGGFFGTLIGSGIFIFILSILLFINRMDSLLIIVGINLFYLVVVVLIALYFYRRTGSKSDSRY